MKNLLAFIRESCYDHAGHASSGRISSYFLLISILISNLCFILIDLSNLIYTLTIQGQTYDIPGMHFAIYGATLAHHLALLGIKMNSKAEPAGTTITEELNKEEIPTGKE